MALPPAWFDPDCRRCPRLAAGLARVRAAHPDYHAAPVPPFGARRARLLVVGLAPGMHGANRTGRPFTGDHAGLLLFATLHKHGFSDRPGSADPRDGLRLRAARISNAVKCLPPDNKPAAAEVAACNRFLAAELAALAPGAVIVALGRIAHDAVLRALALRRADHPFAHGRLHRPACGLHLLDSYHCSRYNTQTGRLSGAMFDAVFARARALLAAPAA